jgi:DNA-binding response OmpR family regulator
VKSELGRGTVFEIFLPKIDSVQGQESEQSEVLQVSEGKVLFVEDDLDQLQTVERILSGIGFDVEAVGESSEAAAKIASDNDYDLMITDYDMPGMNGVELVEMIRRWAPELPVIIVSGREDAVVASAGIENIKKVIIKPYDKAELASAINLILHRN